MIISNGNDSSIEKVDLKQNQSSVVSLKTQYEGSFGATINDSFYLICGGRDEEEMHVKKCQFWEESDSTQQIDSTKFEVNLEKARAFGSALSHKGNLFIFGGEPESDVMKTIEKIDMKTKTSYIIGTIEIDFSYGCMVSYQYQDQDQILLIGGFQQDQRTKKTFKYLFEDFYENPSCSLQSGKYDCI